MAEYIEREAAKKVLAFGVGVTAANALDKIPAADVVEVVRCEKCRFGRNPLPDHGVRQCSKTLMFHPNDWYCPNGARMDGE